MQWTNATDTKTHTHEQRRTQKHRNTENERKIVFDHRMTIADKIRRFYRVYLAHSFCLHFSKSRPLFVGTHSFGILNGLSWPFLSPNSVGLAQTVYASSIYHIHLNIIPWPKQRSQVFLHFFVIFSLNETIGGKNYDDKETIGVRFFLPRFIPILHRTLRRQQYSQLHCL